MQLKATINICIAKRYFYIAVLTTTFYIWVSVHHKSIIYRVSEKECEILRESVPYVELYRYNPKNLYPKLNGYGDNGHMLISIWDGDLNVRIGQQKLLMRFRRRSGWKNNEQDIVASSITISVSESVQRISTCAAWQWTMCTEIILAMRTIWKQEFRTPRFLSHQQNFGAQCTCFSRTARVCKLKEIISSTISKYSE